MSTGELPPSLLACMALAMIAAVCLAVALVRR
jgi:hypothetical protein